MDRSHRQPTSTYFGDACIQRKGAHTVCTHAHTQTTDRPRNRPVALRPTVPKKPQF